jgi:Tol biopolymer transport system component
MVRGTISPDGRSAALVLGSDSGLQLHLLDLRSGTDRTLDLKLPDQLDDSSMVWTPDGRWLFVAGASGYLSVVDVGSGGIRGLDVDLPELTQLAFRSN